MKKTLLVISLGLVLTACGSGGSSSQSNNMEMTKTKSIDFVVDDLKQQVIEMKTIELDDGSVLELANMPVGFNEVKVKEGKVKILNGVYYIFDTLIPNNLKYDEYGQAINVNLEGKQEFGAIFTDINNLPKSGTVTYKGESLGVATRGKLQLDVNFSDKTLTGKIYDRHLESGKPIADINLTNGRISSKNPIFYGDASYLDVKSKFDGAFVGPKGEEVIGHVTKDGAVYVGFGGKRQ
ncbi:hypothetical protein EV697_102103 [Bisgaardia hudsonensis]|uniref:Factor H binding protein-like C-terminal domain-containing protein n=1 Tax=Bisgaardia hudsonensis TaxID=109472 RepID=A0A4R2N130_9PAST|nr:transferrin-binding protein-like solute binding protein [Bisgaardia hudsonensis]QLB13193.1 hypothetical protein A6A11_05990 [Bisgaardia hudsonensis]TCP13230.1 hypothetical protein EV697_102103 [Bisgaardia hudsonensis]